MERPILTGYASKTSFVRKGTPFSLNTTNWLSVAEACQDLAYSLKSSGPNGKRLIVQLFLPGTSIRIDVRNVKAAGVLCVLGISFGIGTYVLYKIYDKYFRPVKKDKKSKKSNRNKDNESCHLETDEGIMGNQQSSLADIPVYYKKGYGVSLYNPSDTDQLRLRHRQSDIHITEIDNHSISSENLQKNTNRVNGMVAITGNTLHEKENVNHGRRVPDISSLKINIDESGFVEDEGTDWNYDKVSIMGNFSPTSLYEKNCRYGLKSDLEIDCDDNIVEHNNVNNNSNGAHTDRLNIETTLKASSVLLTPPSEDETSTSSSRPLMSPSTHQSTKSDVSDIHSEIADHYATEPVETDEEREKMSPLPLDQSPKRTPEKLFKKKLMLKLNEITSRTYSIRSNNSSACSSPERSSRHGSISADYDNSISGVSSPELELLHSEGSEGPAEIPKPFVHLEEEIHHVEDEFETISKKIEELTSKYSNQPVTDPGSQIIDSIFERYPSIRVRQTERGVHFDHMTSLSETDSSHESRYSHDTSTTTNDTEDKSTNEMEDKSTDNDLSWDLENILDAVYSEGSESIPMQNPVIKRLAESERSLDASRRTSTGHDSVFGNSTLNSTVDFDGTLFEDAFHLQLGTTILPKIAENQVTNKPVTNGDVQSKPSICNISERLDIQDYAENEWKGGTSRAAKMKKAYADIPTHCLCCYLRRIRGDNYCGIRGAVFQILVNKLPPHRRWASKHAALKCLSDAFCDKNSGLALWTFANRIPYNSDNKLEVMSRCVSLLYDKFEELAQHSEYTQREQVVERLLNSDPECDLDLMEGVKLLMFLRAVDLHRDMQQGNEVPVFAWLMFARDTSEDMGSFVRNHLNTIGDTGGLEQVEMFLLGYTLGVRIEVFRLSQYGEDDYISYYPDDCSEDWPSISLIAEDDRHYNVPVL